MALKSRVVMYASKLYAKKNNCSYIRLQYPAINNAHQPLERDDRLILTS